MPLENLSSTAAVETMKSNAASVWPKRGGETRLNPIAKPRLRPKFTLEPGEAVFTIGSCFARNVERELATRGFILPANQAIQNNPDLSEFGTTVLNNYATPSIYNEIYWALERDYKDDECFVQMGKKWVDMHLPNTWRPTDLETCRIRRAVITEAYRQIPECRVIVITLGLSEVWYDTKTDTYLNASPRRGTMRDEPGRFELHILSFDEALGFMRKAMDLIAIHGRNDVRVLMTVSPVPLSATYRDMDVMEANTYSKAVLRVVAEHIRNEYDFVDYYPSYESIMLSDRAIAWQDDEVHVSPEIVAVNIGRMVQAYTGTEEMTLEELQGRLPSERPDVQMRLIEDFPQHLEYLEHRGIATFYVNAAVQLKQFDKAAEWLHNADDPLGLSAGSIYFHRKEYRKAIDSLKELKYFDARYYRLKLKAYLALGQMDNADDTMREWTARSPNAYEAHSIMAKAIDDLDKATPHYERAIELSGENPRIVVEFAERLLNEGEAPKAKALVIDLNPDFAPLRRRIDIILAAI